MIISAVQKGMTASTPPAGPLRLDRRMRPRTGGERGEILGDIVAVAVLDLYSVHLHALRIL